MYLLFSNHRSHLRIWDFPFSWSGDGITCNHSLLYTRPCILQKENRVELLQIDMDQTYQILVFLGTPRKYMEGSKFCVSVLGKIWALIPFYYESLYLVGFLTIHYDILTADVYLWDLHLMKISSHLISLFLGYWKKCYLNYTSNFIS